MHTRADPFMGSDTILLPSLQSLYTFNCTNLESTPTPIGLTFYNSIYIKDCITKTSSFKPWWLGASFYSYKREHRFNKHQRFLFL